MRQFYLAFQNTHILCAELSWSHYRLLMRVEDSSRREFYHRECAESSLSVRQLERQINSFFYERLLAMRKSGRSSVKNEIQTLEPKTDPDYILKDPYIENLFASKYMLYLPTEEELKRELERERELIERRRSLDGEAEQCQS